jgi:predicted DNA-binding transcriptional regulator AlpA
MINESEIAAAPIEDLPAIIGELARLTALAQGRFLHSSRTQPETKDRLLSAKEAAALLGVPRDVVYKLKGVEAFRVRVSAGRVRFSEKKLLAYIDRRTR